MFSQQKISCFIVTTTFWMLDPVKNNRVATLSTRDALSNKYSTPYKNSLVTTCSMLLQVRSFTSLLRDTPNKQQGSPARRVQPVVTPNMTKKKLVQEVTQKCSTRCTFKFLVTEKRDWQTCPWIGPQNSRLPSYVEGICLLNPQLHALR